MLELLRQRWSADGDRKLPRGEHGLDVGAVLLEHRRRDVLAAQSLILIEAVDRPGLTDLRRGAVLAQKRSAGLPHPGRKVGGWVRGVLAGDAKGRDLAGPLDRVQRVVEVFPAAEGVGGFDTEALEDVGAVKDGAGVDKPGDGGRLAGLVLTRRLPYRRCEGSGDADGADLVGREFVQAAGLRKGSDPSCVDLRHVWACPTRQRGPELAVGVGARQLCGVDSDVGMANVESLDGILHVLLGVDSVGQVPEIDRGALRGGVGACARRGEKQSCRRRQPAEASRGSHPVLNVGVARHLPMVGFWARGSLPRRGRPPGSCPVDVLRARVGAPAAGAQGLPEAPQVRGERVHRPHARDDDPPPHFLACSRSM